MNFIPFPTLFLGKEIAHELTVFCAGCTYMWTVLQKVAYDATNSTRNFAKLCQNLPELPNYTPGSRNCAHKMT